MKTEKLVKAFPGGGMLLLALACLGLAVYLFSRELPLPGGILIFCFFFILAGLTIINPNESRVLLFFGNYVGTVKDNGLFWVFPLYSKVGISLRARNLNGQTLKVNDKMGNPIEIAAVIVWQIEDTARALFEVNDYMQYVSIQSEAAVRHLANSCPYDILEDESAEITLRGSSEKVNEMLEQELTERLAMAGIKVIEARISHLAYAAEIAQAMLQRQQAAAVVSARKQIVEGAVGMVEMALQKLSERQIVELDDERKAAMVSNLLVILCSEKSASPVVNAGTLYH